MYRTTECSTEIVKKECTKVTDKTLFYIGATGRECRELITTNYGKWHKTKEDAINQIQDKAKRNLESAKWRLSKAKEFYEQAMQLKP